jgi:hypothetical protein
MNVIMTAEVTYIIKDVDTIEDAQSIFQTCVTSEARHIGVEYVGTKEAFATQMNDTLTFDSNPEIWELGEI